jgi:hypothetical protein
MDALYLNELLVITDRDDSEEPGYGVAEVTDT